jgi:adenylyl- and sulfurtransferase ThiI
MNRQQDVIMLFDFLIELLKERNTVVEAKQETTISTPETNTQVEETTDNFGASHILELMRKVDSISKQKAQIQSELKEQEKSFDKEIKRLKEEHEKKIKDMESVLNTDLDTPQNNIVGFELEKD